MFEMIFSDYLNPEHELLRASELIDWDGLHDGLSKFYSPLGRSGKPIRLMVGIHILKHRYNSSDERAVEELHENAYWQCFCGFESFQKGWILDATSMVKFRNRIGTEGMRMIEQVLLQSWTDMGLVKSKRVLVDTTPMPKDIAYPTDADLLHKVREKIVKQVKQAGSEVAFRKPFRTFSRVGKRALIEVKKVCKTAEAKKAKVKEIAEMTDKVVRQAERLVNSLYANGKKELGRKLSQAVRLGKKIVQQTQTSLAGEKPEKRIYSLHEPKVAAIKKGKSHISCEFGSVVAVSVNYDGVVLSHVEYQENVGDVKTLGPTLSGVKQNTGHTPKEVGADRGFDQSEPKRSRLRRRWNIERMSIPKKGKRPHPDHNEPWFKRCQRKRSGMEAVIGHLKNDHRMNRCRYQGPQGDTANVVWATLAWNMKKITRLAEQKQRKITKQAA